MFLSRHGGGGGGGRHSNRTKVSHMYSQNSMISTPVINGFSAKIFDQHGVRRMPLINLCWCIRFCSVAGDMLFVCSYAFYIY